MGGFSADYHSHSSFSEDSNTPAEAMVLGAIKRELAEICLTEHKDLDPFYPGRDFYDDRIYTQEVNRLNDKYCGLIKVKKGIELDYQSETEERFKEFLGNHEFDFVIGSVHALEHYFVDKAYFRGKDPQRVFRAYLEEVAALSRLDCHDVIGHPDYITRHAPEGQMIQVDKYRDLLTDIFENVIKNRRGIEINTAGWRHGIGKAYPSLEILKLYRQIGGEIVTIGSDAHRDDDVGRDFSRAASLLKDAGFSGFYVYDKRIPEKVLFEDEGNSPVLINKNVAFIQT